MELCPSLPETGPLLFEPNALLLTLPAWASPASGAALLASSQLGSPLSPRKRDSVWWKAPLRQPGDWYSFPTRVQKKFFTVPLLGEASKSLATVHLWVGKWDPVSRFFLRGDSQLKDWYDNCLGQNKDQVKTGAGTACTRPPQKSSESKRSQQWWGSEG